MRCKARLLNMSIGLVEEIEGREDSCVSEMGRLALDKQFIPLFRVRLRLSAATDKAANKTRTDKRLVR